MPKRVILIAAAGCLLMALGAPGQDAALQQRINTAIDKGVQYLRAVSRDGKGRIVYTGHEAARHPGENIGVTALVAWTCVESGVAGDSSDIARLADAVREGCLELHDTYSLSVAIMFLDRLGDPGDEPLIEAMALRLLGGRSPGGTWGYTCPEPVKSDVNSLKNQVEEARERREKGEIGPAKTRPMVNRQPTPEMIKRVKKIAPNYQTAMDNSNTQFAMLALWVARRHGVPVDDALTQVAQHFRGTQAQSAPGTSPVATPVEGNYSGMWGYRGTNPPSVTMTCAGLLGVALGHGVARKKDKQATDLNKDPNFLTGLRALDGLVKHSKTTRDVFFLPDRDPRCIYYFLFSLERMAVVYNLKQIGGRDWYTWGASFLIDAQDSGGDGSENMASPTRALPCCSSSERMWRRTSLSIFWASIPSKSPKPRRRRKRLSPIPSASCRSCSKRRSPRRRKNRRKNRRGFHLCEPGTMLFVRRLSPTR